MLGLTAMVAAACLGATLAPATAQAAPATPRLGLEIGSLAFSVQELGVASPAQDVLLHNLGDATLHVATVHATGRYTAADDCRADPGDAVTLDPGESCAVHVTVTVPPDVAARRLPGTDSEDTVALEAPAPGAVK